MIFTITKNEKELYLRDGVFSKKGYVLDNSATEKWLKRVQWIGGLLWLIAMLAVVFVDNWSVPFLWLGVTGLFYFLMVKTIGRITRECEVVTLQESKSELLHLGFEKTKTSSLVLSCILFFGLSAMVIRDLVRGVEEPAYESTVLAIFLAVASFYLFVLLKRIGQAKADGKSAQE